MIFLKLIYFLSKFIKKIQLPSIKNSSFGKKSKVMSGSQVVSSVIGKYTYLGYNCIVINSTIGSFCSIANDVKIGGASHPMSWVSTSPVFCSGKNILKTNISKHNFKPNTSVTIIENDVWIGYNCIIKSGVKISNGAVVGMGSIVTKNIGPYEIWAGNPAKMIKKRFSEDTITQLLKSEWWHWDEHKLSNYSNLMNNVPDFLNQTNKN